MRLVIARCSVDYTGRLNAHLPLATRLLVHKGDGSLLVHSDGGSYKPLNWMSPPCALTTEQPSEDESIAGVAEVWRVTHRKSGDALRVQIYEVIHDSSHELGVDPGLQKDGVEADLQRLLAEQVDLIADGATLVRREYPTAIGPVDLLVRDAGGTGIAVEVSRLGGAECANADPADANPADANQADVDPADVDPVDVDPVDGKPANATPANGKPVDTAPAKAKPTAARHIAVEVKRKANIDAVEQLTRYLELLNRDSHIAPVRGILAAQSIAPQARTLAIDRGIDVLLLDYEAMKGVDSGVPTLF